MLPHWEHFMKIWVHWSVCSRLPCALGCAFLDRLGFIIAVAVIMFVYTLWLSGNVFNDWWLSKHWTEINKQVDWNQQTLSKLSWWLCAYSLAPFLNLALTSQDGESVKAAIKGSWNLHKIIYIPCYPFTLSVVFSYYNHWGIDKAMFPVLDRIAGKWEMCVCGWKLVKSLGLISRGMIWMTEMMRMNASVHLCSLTSLKNYWKDFVTFVVECQNRKQKKAFYNFITHILAQARNKPLPGIFGFKVTAHTQIYSWGQNY